MRACYLMLHFKILLAGQAEVFNSWFANVLVWNVGNILIATLATMSLNLSPSACHVIFIGKANLGAALDHCLVAGLFWTHN